MGSRSAARFPTWPRPGGWRCGWTRMAAATSKGWTRRGATPCWSARRPARSAATAATPSCATWSAPASRRRRSGACARRSMRQASRCASWSPPVRRGEVPGHGRCEGADRPRRHRLLHPRDWHQTYATADIVAYGNEARVKVGVITCFPHTSGASTTEAAPHERGWDLAGGASDLSGGAEDNVVEESARSRPSTTPTCSPAATCATASSGAGRRGWTRRGPGIRGSRSARTGSSGIWASRVAQRDQLHHFAARRASKEDRDWRSPDPRGAEAEEE